MCLTIPKKIKKVAGQQASLSGGGQVSIALIKNAQAGDWVLINADLAVAKVSAKEAKEINNYLK